MVTISFCHIHQFEVAGCVMTAPTSLHHVGACSVLAPLPGKLSKITDGLCCRSLRSHFQENPEMPEKLRMCTSAHLLGEMRHLQFFEVAFQSGLETRAHGRRPEDSILHYEYLGFRV